MTPSQKATLAPFTIDELIAELRSRIRDTDMFFTRYAVSELEFAANLNSCGGRTGTITKNYGGSHVISDTKAA